MNRDAVIAGLKSGKLDKIPFSLRNDKEAILTRLTYAIENDKTIAKPHISKHFYNDRDIVMALAKNNIKWIYKRNKFEHWYRNTNLFKGLVDKVLYDDEEVVLTILEAAQVWMNYHRCTTNYSFTPDFDIRCASHRLRVTSEFLLKAAKLDPYNIFFSDKSFKTNADFMAEAAEVNGQTIEYAEGDAERIWDNEKVMLTAVKSYPRAVSKLSNRLLNNETFLKEMIIANPKCAAVLHYTLNDKKKCIDIFASVLKQKPSLYNEISSPIGYLADDPYAIIKIGKVLDAQDNKSTQNNKKTHPLSSEEENEIKK